MAGEGEEAGWPTVRELAILAVIGITTAVTAVVATVAVDWLFLTAGGAESARTAVLAFSYTGGALASLFIWLHLLAWLFLDEQEEEADE